MFFLYEFFSLLWNIEAGWEILKTGIYLIFLIFNSFKEPRVLFQKKKLLQTSESSDNKNLLKILF